MCCRVSYCCLFCGTVSEGSRSVGLVTAAFNLLGLAVGIVRGNVLASAYFGIMAAAGGMLAVGAVGRRRSSGEGFFCSPDKCEIEVRQIIIISWTGYCLPDSRLLMNSYF